MNKKIKAALWGKGWISGYFEEKEDKIVFFRTKYYMQMALLMGLGACGGFFIGIYGSLFEITIRQVVVGLFCFALLPLAAFLLTKHFEKTAKSYLEFSAEDFKDISDGQCGYKIARYPSKIIKTQDGNAHEFVIINKNLTAFNELVKA